MGANGETGRGDMLTIWGRANSANVQKPMWLIGELGLEHRRIDVGGPFGGLDAPEFRELTPHRVIPVLQDDDLTVWESTAILRYLAEIYGDDALWPVDAKDRARIDMWIDWTNTSWVPAITQLFNAYVRTPTANRAPAALQRVVNAAGAVAQRADEQLAGRPFLAADHFTLADIAFGVLLFRFFTLETPRPDLPNLQRYYAALQERPAYRDHAMIDYEAMRVPGAERPAA